MAQELNYETIDRPFDAFMQRTGDTNPPIGASGTALANTSGLASGASVGAGVEGGLTDLSSAGSNASTPGYNNVIQSGNIFKDVWMSTWIKSQDYLPKSRGFLIDARTGYIECMSLFVTGDVVLKDITLLGGNISYGKTSFTDSTNAGYWISSAGVYMGAVADTSRLKFDIVGNTFKVGGWTIGKDTISSSSISLDSSLETITVGSSTPNLVINGSGKFIRTSTFASGAQGFTLDGATGDAEFNNLSARGEIHSQVLSYNSVHVTAGSELLALSGGSLAADVTTVTSPTTFSVSVNDPPSGHLQMFVVNDILRIKDGSGADNWLKVSSVTESTAILLLETGSDILLETGDLLLGEGVQGFAYTCTLQSGTPATFRAGAAIADYGQTGQGLIFSTVDSLYSPYISVQTHAGSPWTTISEHLRLGNLHGTMDYGADIYGLAVGSSAGTDANITIDPTNGIRIRNGTTNVLSFDNAGNANISNTLTAGAAIIVGTGGNIHSGQTAYATGTGWWWEYNGGTPRFSVGKAAGNFLTFDGTTITLTGGTITGTFSGNTSGSTSTMSTFTTTGSNNVSRVSIANATYGTPTQAANSFAIVAGSVLALQIAVPSGSLGDFIVKHTPDASDSQLLINSSVTTSSDLSASADGVITLNATNASGKVNLLRLSDAGDGAPLTISQTLAGAAKAPIEVSGGLITANALAKFRRMIKGKNRTIWEVDDTTTPNGNLSGVAGDLCMCGDGNIYRCTGTNVWVAM